MYVLHPQFKYQLSLFYLNLCLLSHLCLPSSILWNTGPYLLWVQHQSWSQSLFKLHPSPIIADITGHFWHCWSNSNLHTGTTLTGAPNRVGVIEVLIVRCSDAWPDAWGLGVAIECCDRVKGMEIRYWRSELEWNLTIIGDLMTPKDFNLFSHPFTS